MDLNLNNKIIIITGGAKGIGASISMTLATEGAIPIIIDRSLEAGKSLEKSIFDAGYQCFYIQKSLEDSKSCDEVIREVYSRFGAIDGLVNNAGKNDGVGLEKGTPEAFDLSLMSNLGHFYYMAHFALPYLKKNKGNIVNISSKTAVTGQGNTSGYAAAKGAIMALTREWAVELLPYSIRVNCIIPAEVYTPLYANWLKTFPNPDLAKQQIEQKVPFEKRMTSAEEIANATVFLLSDKSSHTTGQHWYIDGGYTHLDRNLT
jgi:L-fucose dehydrogenase